MSNYNKLIIDDTIYETKLTKQFVNRKKYVPENINLVKAFIPGTIRDIYVSVGSEVKVGDKLLILEAMKMKNLINSNVEGKVKNIYITSEQIVMKNELLLEIE